MWKHVAVLMTKDFEKAQKMISTHVPGNWVADKWSRGGKVAYGDVPKCDWRRRMANDGKKIVRLIQHKGKVIERFSKQQSFLELRTSRRRRRRRRSRSRRRGGGGGGG